MGAGGGGGVVAEGHRVEIKIKVGMERAGGKAISHNHTHSVYTCLYSHYRNTLDLWTCRLSDECGYLYTFSDSLRPWVFALLAVGEATLAVCECQCTHYGTALTDEDTCN